MIPAVSQTLAKILACQTSLGTVQQVSFERPQLQRSRPVGVNLYAYDVRRKAPPSASPVSAGPSDDEAMSWKHSSLVSESVEVFFLVVASDWTRLGEQQLLAEAINYFTQHSEIPEDHLVPDLRGCGSINVEIAHPADIAALWRALEVPLQPALYLKVTLPWVNRILGK